MANNKSAGPSPESIARANRQRLAQEEGAKAMADIERDAVAIRKNMDRLRLLRETRDAQAAAAPPVGPTTSKKKPKRTTAQR